MTEQNLATISPYDTLAAKETECYLDGYHWPDKPPSADCPDCHGTGKIRQDLRIRVKRVLTGRRFGKLIAMKVVGRSKDRAVLWLCRCECGKERVFASTRLLNGDAKSCGRHKQEARRTHGMSRSLPGRRRTPEYASWQNMRRRCLGLSDKKYYAYGGRGITIDPRWDKFENFLADMGQRPFGTSLDRIDNDGIYEPTNCRWATSVQQHASQRRNHRGQTHCKRGHEFTKENTYVHPTTRGRVCRTCKNVGERLWVARKRYES